MQCGLPRLRLLQQMDRTPPRTQALAGPRFGNAFEDPPPQDNPAVQALFRAIGEMNLQAFDEALWRLDEATITDATGMTPIQCLISQQDMPTETGCRMMEALLRKGADPNPSPVVYTPKPLLWVLKRFNESPQRVSETVEALFRAGADINARPDSDMNMVSAFIRQGVPGSNQAQATQLLKRLLAARPTLYELDSANVLEEVATGFRPDKNTAKRQDWVEGVKALCDYGMKMGYQAAGVMQGPVQNGLMETYLYLRTKLPAPSLRDPENDATSTTLRFLMKEAAKAGQIDMLKVILKEPVDFSWGTNNPQTLMAQMLREETPNLAVVKTLVQEGKANPSDSTGLSDFPEATALHYVSRGKPRYTYTDPYSAMYGGMYGFGYGGPTEYDEWIEAMETLLEATAIDLNIKDQQLHTPLMVACNQGHVSVVRRLLDAGADPTATYSEGKDARTLVRESSLPDNKKRVLVWLLEDAIRTWQQEKGQ